MTSDTINTEFYNKLIARLEDSLQGVQTDFDEEQTKTPAAEMHDIFRAACVKYFELILEQSGKLLRKRLKPFFSSPQGVDKLIFKDVFRYAAKHGLLSTEESERWLEYRDNRNDTAHNYGEDFAVKTMILLPQFIADARALSVVLSLKESQ